MNEDPAMTTSVYAPDGAVGAPPVRLAPSPLALTGLRIAVLDNEKPNARILMVRAAEQLATRTGAIVALVTDKGPGANAATPCTGATLDRIGKEVDLVLTGSAD
jgi:hypothetical protein